jgi:hypothetical protein
LSADKSGVAAGVRTRDMSHPPDARTGAYPGLSGMEGVDKGAGT